MGSGRFAASWRPPRWPSLPVLLAVGTADRAGTGSVGDQQTDTKRQLAVCAASRARHQTTLYPVVGPEPQGPAELDLPDREPGDGYAQLARALARAGDQTLAIDTPSSPDLRRLTTGELRAERDRLRRLLDQAPRDRSRELSGRPRAGPRRMRPWSSSPPTPIASGRGGGCFAGRGESSRPRPIGPRRWPASRPSAPTTPSSGCASSSSAEPAGWLAGWRRMPTSAPPTARSSASWPGSAAPMASPPSMSSPATSTGSSARYPSRPGPTGLAAGRRHRGLPPHLPDQRSEQPLGRLPGEPTQRAAWQQARQAIARAQGRQHSTGRDRQPQCGTASRPAPIDRRHQERAAG
jgi:hypothetical protein